MSGSQITKDFIMMAIAIIGMLVLLFIVGRAPKPASPNDLTKAPIEACAKKGSRYIIWYTDVERGGIDMFGCQDYLVFNTESVTKADCKSKGSRYLATYQDLIEGKEGSYRCTDKPLVHMVPRK